jgi:hypothetical protein
VRKHVVLAAEHQRVLHERGVFQQQLASRPCTPAEYPGGGAWYMWQRVRACSSSSCCCCGLLLRAALTLLVLLLQIEQGKSILRAVAEELAAWCDGPPPPSPPPSTRRVTLVAAELELAETAAAAELQLWQRFGRCFWAASRRQVRRVLLLPPPLVGANGYSCASHPFPRGCQSGAVSTLFARGTPSVLCKPQPARSDGGHPYPRSVSSSQLKLLHEKPFILRTPERDWCVVTLQLPAPWHKCQYWHRIT